jgi:hypothetical protein
MRKRIAAGSAIARGTRITRAVARVSGAAGGLGGWCNRLKQRASRGSVLAP